MQYNLFIRLQPLLQFGCQDSLVTKKSQNVVNLTHMHLQTTEFVLVILPSVREKEDFIFTREKKKPTSAALD